MEYFLMRKDELVTLCDFSEDGRLISYSKKLRNPELAPLEQRTSDNYLKDWWDNRHIPLRQGRIEQMLKEKGIYDPANYLLRNLGLSLTDYYWIKPINSELKWKDVNLFTNDFKDNLMESLSDDTKTKPPAFSPNSSLKGELEKTWIIRNDKRMLIKGNHGESSQESINEVIASEFHSAQGYDNYTKYELTKIKGKKYEYGCCSEAFTSENVELVSAHAIISSEKRPEGMSVYEHLIKVTGKHGMDEDKFRADLEYQILSDYLLSNVDRHMENIGVLRDAVTLEFIRMAPIFDTGRAFAAGLVTPYTDDEIDNIEVNSFEERESGLLELVKDKKRVDTSKLLRPERIEGLYAKDSKIKEFTIASVKRLYEEKVKRIEKHF